MPTAKLIIADSETPRQFILGDALSKASWETTMLDQPGKLTCDIVDVGSEMFFEGSNIVLEVDNTKVFDGYVFTRKRTQDDVMSITAYDRLRYLQNKDVAVFSNKSAGEIFTQLCKEQQLPHKVVSPRRYKTAPITHDNASLWSMIKRALDEDFVATGEYCIIRDNVGVLELVDIATLTTNLLIGDASLLTGFDFESSIDQNTYNYVKLVQEDTNASVRNVYVVKDSSTIYKWGRLQYFEKVDKDANASQIKAKADQLLKLYNRKTRSLHVKCLGDPRITAGSGVGLSIGKLTTEGFAPVQYVFVSKASHSLSSGEHTMSLTLEVV